jgi:hypothetical protein
VEDDKAQITAVIQQLDEKKRVALEETWKHVSHCCCGHRPCGPLHPHPGLGLAQTLLSHTVRTLCGASM